MKIWNKIKWVSGVVLVFAIVLATNLIDRDNFSKLRQSTTTIYKDRIVASDILFDLSHLIQQKKLTLATADTNLFKRSNATLSDSIQALLSNYEQTKLTDKEAGIFNSLKGQLISFEELENDYFTGDIDKEAFVQLIAGIDENLYKLSKVQLYEGKLQMLKSNKAMESVELFTQIEIIFLVIAGILIQVIILYTPKSKRKF
ncbi:Four helix bundle sensory module for signal transduction [Lishizhenia tianjinensis]|uniref:Four helix bundle sensory module for signal transduction n=1 Tax=Lishizhenia tianjinensis TaxID=477690 RepID=A0A1I6YCQ5_9FLAO|nr:MCP four helix bundle domain-containing protein [Lishizhenia tianjinensis]SFT48170.1 Four helix bundle sensory module for signal transduction [Lishizhenia tianjinensis]